MPVPRGAPIVAIVYRAPDVEGTSEGHGHERRVAHRGETNEMRPIPKVRTHDVPRFQGQACLADASRSDQGQEPDRRRHQAFDDCRNFWFAADQRGRRKRERTDAAAPVDV